MYVLLKNVNNTFYILYKSLKNVKNYLHNFLSFYSLDQSIKVLIKYVKINIKDFFAH